MDRSLESRGNSLDKSSFQTSDQPGTFECTCSLYIKPARLNCYKNSFFIRIVKLWNELPGDIVEADSFQHFKSKLKSYLNI